MAKEIELVYRDSPADRLEGTIRIRNMLRKGKHSSIQRIIGTGVVPRLVRFLTDNSSTRRLQLEAAWCLTNIAAGTDEHTNILNILGAIEAFVELIHSIAKLRQHTHEDDALWEQAVWFLGNIAANSPIHRDFVLNLGVLSPLLARLARYLDRDDSASMFSTVAWTLSNFSRGSPKPFFKQIRPMLPFLRQLIESSDQGVVSEACWALFELSDGAKDKIQAVIDSRVCCRLVHLLSNKSPSVIIPTLLTVGNIFSGDAKQTLHTMNYNELLPNLLGLLSDNLVMSGDEMEIIRSGVYYTISNMTAGNREHIQAIIDSGIIDRVIFLFQTAERNIKIKAIEVVSNASSLGNHEQIIQLVIKGCIKPLCEMLQSEDLRTIDGCLDGLENISRVGEAERNLGRSGGINMYVEMIEGGGGFERINLPYCISKEINEKAAKFRTNWLKTNDTTPLLFKNYYFNWGVLLIVAFQFFALVLLLIRLHLGS